MIASIKHKFGKGKSRFKAQKGPVNTSKDKHNNRSNNNHTDGSNDPVQTNDRFIPLAKPKSDKKHRKQLQSDINDPSQPTRKRSIKHTSASRLTPTAPPWEGTIRKTIAGGLTPTAPPWEGTVGKTRAGRL